MQAPKLINKWIFNWFWTIQNHPTVARNAESLPQAEQLIKQPSNTGIIYLGKIGYQMVGPDLFSPCLTIAKQKPESSHCDISLLSWSLWYGRPADNQFFLIPSVQTETITTENKAMVLPNVKFRTNSQFSFLFPDLSVHWKIEFTIWEYSTTADPWNKFVSASTSTHKQNWAKSLENVDHTTADLKIICSDGVELLAHQLVLSEQNEVFGAMLKHKDTLEGRTGVIRLTDVGSGTMRILLHFFYTGELPADEWKKPENIVEFTSAAEKYMLNDVRAMLDDHLGIFDHGANTVQLMSLADKLDLQKAKERLLARVKEMVQKAGSVSDVIDLFGDPYPLMHEG